MLFEYLWCLPFPLYLKTLVPLLLLFTSASKTLSHFWSIHHLTNSPYLQLNISTLLNLQVAIFSRLCRNDDSLCLAFDSLLCSFLSYFDPTQFLRLLHKSRSFSNFDTSVYTSFPYPFLACYCFCNPSYLPFSNIQGLGGRLLHIGPLSKRVSGKALFCCLNV